MRDILPVLAVGLLVILVGVFGYFALFDDDLGQQVTLQRVSGEVRLNDAGAEAGATLAPGDRLVAGDDGQAVLAFGERSSIVLEQSSSLRLRGAGSEGLDVELEGGRVKATVRPGDGRLGIRSGEQTVEATDATFQVGLDDEGGVVVRTEDGEVSLAGFGDRTGLGPGERISLAPGGDPWVSDEDRAMLLDLDPAQELIASREQVLTGLTDPYARVRVEGGARTVGARADGDGRFEVTVPLNEGDNRLVVVAVDALGEERELPWQVAVDTRPPEAVDITVGGP